MKDRYLAAIGYVCAAGESPAQAFDRLRIENPDAFPVPRCSESVLDACAEVVRNSEPTKRAELLAKLTSKNEEQLRLERMKHR